MQYVSYTIPSLQRWVKHLARRRSSEEAYSGVLSTLVSPSQLGVHITLISFRVSDARYNKTIMNGSRSDLLWKSLFRLFDIAVQINVMTLWLEMRLFAVRVKFFIDLLQESFLDEVHFRICKAVKDLRGIYQVNSLKMF